MERPTSTWRNPALLAFGLSCALALTVLVGLASTAKDSHLRQQSNGGHFTQLYTFTTDAFAKIFGDDESQGGDSSSSTEFQLLSKDMTNGGNMPYTYTCLAKNGGVSPPLYWKNVPSGTKQFLLTMQTDAFAHNGEYILTRCDWALYGIPKSATSIDEDTGDAVGVIGGTYPGTPMYNYNAPCPFGSGNNTYYFTLYALSDDLQSTVEAKKETKEKFDVGLKMILYASKKGIILGSAQLAVSFCMYSDDKASCKTAAEGGEFKEPVTMELWNADDYVMEEDEQRTDSEAGRGFQDVSATTTTKTEHHPPSLLCDWCDADADAEEAR